MLSSIRPLADTHSARVMRAPGQTVVEFALAVPVFFLLLFGVLQMGVLIKTIAAYDEGVMQAGRVAAAAGNAGNADVLLLNALQQNLAGQNLQSIQSVTVYDSTVSGSQVNSTAVTNYVYVGNHFACAGATTVMPPTPCPGSYWNPLVRNTTVGTLDHIGIKVTYNSSGPTNILPPLQLSTLSVTLMEPTEFNS